MDSFILTTHKKGDIMSLQSAIAEAKKATATTSTVSEKNPAYYNKRKGLFIDELCTHENAAVRIAALTCEYCPTGAVNEALKTETNQEVLRAILMGPRVAVKSISTFASTERSHQFDDDIELQEHLAQRIAGANPGSAPGNASVSDENDFLEGSEEEEE